MTISSLDGSEHIDFELADAGLNKDILIFDLNTGNLISSDSCLKTARPYALLCDEVLTLVGAHSADYFTKNGRRLYRFHENWTDDIRLELRGLTYWRPRISQVKPLQRPDLLISNQRGAPARLGSYQHLVVYGVPPDALTIVILIGKIARPIQMEYSADSWQTTEPICLDVSLLTGTTRLRLQLHTPNRNRCWPVKTQWNVIGLAVLEQQAGHKYTKWNILDHKKPLNRAGGRWRARVFYPTDALYLQILEDARTVINGQRPFNLSGLLARGQPLKNREGYTFADSVEDRGCFVRFYPRLLGRSFCSVLLNDRIELSHDHKVVLWFADHTIQITSAQDNTKNPATYSEWILPNFQYDRAPIAWAVAFRGELIGSHWRYKELAESISRGPTMKSFALLRWFKAPVFNSKIAPQFLRYVRNHQVAFVRSWMDDCGLPNELTHTESAEELYPLVRCALWKCEPQYPTHADQILQSFVKRIRVYSENRSSEVLRTLGVREMARVCPPFAFRLLRKIRKGNKLARLAVRELLILASDDSRSEWNTAITYLRRDAERQLGRSPDRLGKLTRAFSKSIDGISTLDMIDEHSVRQLAETSRGLDYLAVTALLLVDRRDILSFDLADKH